MSASGIYRPAFNNGRARRKLASNSTGSVTACPNDVLAGILDVARLAVHAVLRVDLKSRVAFVGADDFIDARWTIARFRAAEFIPVHRDCLRGIKQVKMRRLVFLVIGVADEH